MSPYIIRTHTSYLRFVSPALVPLRMGTLRMQYFRERREKTEGRGDEEDDDKVEFNPNLDPCHRLACSR